MPRRDKPDPLARTIGRRIRALRLERGMTAERLAYESDVGSKGFLSDIERGLARPSVTTLAAIARHLDVALFDLLTFPAKSPRSALVDATRHITPGAVRRLLREVRSAKRKKR